MDIVNDKVVRLDVVRLKRNYSKHCNCLNPHYIVDNVNRMVECADCGAIIDPFQAMHDLAWHYQRINNQADAMRKEALELNDYKPRLRTIKYLEGQYSGTTHSMVPACPHCGQFFDLKELERVCWQSKSVYERSRKG